MSRTSFRVNPHSIVCLNAKALLSRSRRHIWSLSDNNEIRTHNHLVREPFSQTGRIVSLRTKWLWVRISLLSLKLQIRRLLRAKSSLKPVIYLCTNIFSCEMAALKISNLAFNGFNSDVVFNLHFKCYSPFRWTFIVHTVPITMQNTIS